MWLACVNCSYVWMVPRRCRLIPLDMSTIQTLGVGGVVLVLLLILDRAARRKP